MPPTGTPQDPILITIATKTQVVSEPVPNGRIFTIKSTLAESFQFRFPTTHPHDPAAGQLGDQVFGPGVVLHAVHAGTHRFDCIVGGKALSAPYAGEIIVAPEGKSIDIEKLIRAEQDLRE